MMNNGDDIGTDQLLVRVGKACNFKCNFCNVSDNERNVKLKEGIKDIVRNFHYKLKYSNLDSGKLTITISGGEPSIFKKETIFTLKYIHSFLKKKGVTPFFEIQTNAANIDYAFAKKISMLGIKKALVSFHMIDKGIFEEVLGISYSQNFHRIIEGINNLHNNGIVVSTNTILSNQNKENFYDTLLFLVKKLPFLDHYNIGLVQPHGEALKNIDKVIPSYSEVSGIYNRAMFFLKSKNKGVTSHFVGLPACYIGHFKESLEVTDNNIFRKNFNFSEKYLINNINDQNKTQISDCNTCLYNNVCSGIWKEYSGIQKLNPTLYVRDFFGNFSKNNFCFKVNKIHDDLKEIYSSNIRQLIIPSSIGTQDEIIHFIRQATQMGFYKSTLLYNSDFKLDRKILFSGVSNIQVNINHINIDFIVQLLDFSKKYSPQFRVNLDIFVLNYSNEILNKLEQIFKHLPSDYLCIYFISNYVNKDIYKYSRILETYENINHNIYTVNFYKKLIFKFDYS